MSDEDWFEQAVGDDEDDQAAEADGETTEEAAADDREDGSTADDETVAAEVEALGTDESSDAADEPSDVRDPPEAGDATGGDEGAFAPADVDPDAADDRDGGSGLFDEDFTAALQEAEDEGFGKGRGADPADPEFAMGTDAGGGFGDVGVEDLDGELDSEIPRIDLGIEGLDEMIQGGVPNVR